MKLYILSGDCELFSISSLSTGSLFPLSLSTGSVEKLEIKWFFLLTAIVGAK